MRYFLLWRSTSHVVDIPSRGYRSRIRRSIPDKSEGRNILFVRAGKGLKDRMIPIVDGLLLQARGYFKAYQPKISLFEGLEGGQYTSRSSQQVIKQAMARAGISKSATLHTLRHSFATQTIESGTYIRYIQAILGHNGPKTTMTYTHVRASALGRIRGPIEDILNGTITETKFRNTSGGTDIWK